eukprot:PhF_6_TR4775/c0_g1_i2/m.6589
MTSTLVPVDFIFTSTPIMEKGNMGNTWNEHSKHIPHHESKPISDPQEGLLREWWNTLALWCYQCDGAPGTPDCVSSVTPGLYGTLNVWFTEGDQCRLTMGVENEGYVVVSNVPEVMTVNEITCLGTQSLSEVLEIIASKIPRM